MKEVSPVNLRIALVNSDNICFAQQTLRMGEDKFRASPNEFTFDEELDLSIAMTPVQIPNEDRFNSEILLADVSYGQGQLLISSIQQTTMYNVFQNNGTSIYPRLILDKETKKKDNVISADVANTIATDLLGGVEDPSGYVYNIYSLNFSLAARTGTAEIEDKQGTDNKENSFLLALDRSNGKFLTMIMVENLGEDGFATDVSKPLINYLEATTK